MKYILQLALFIHSTCKLQLENIFITLTLRMVFIPRSQHAAVGYDEQGLMSVYVHIYFFHLLHLMPFKFI